MRKYTLAGQSYQFRKTSLNDLVMLKPEEIAAINAEIDRLEKALKDCSDSGLRKWIEAAIEKQKRKQKLASGNNPG
jgi:hypothetical protein